MKLPKDKTKKSSVVFYVLHLPLLLMLALVFGLSTLISSKIASNKISADIASKGEVLSSGSDNDDGDKEEEDKEDDKDSDDDDNSDDNDDSDDDDSDDDSDENEDESEDEEGDDRDDDLDDDKNENEMEKNKYKSQETIQNSNGTYSVVKKEIEGNKSKVEVKTYNSAGKLLEEEKTEVNDDGIESETEDSDGNKLKIRIQDNEALIKSEGVDGLKNFPLYLNDEDGKVYVETPNGDVQLGVMPQAILDKIESDDDSVDVEEIEIETDDNNSLEFRLKTTKKEKLFGLFSLEVPATNYYDTQTGDLIRTDQTTLDKLIDFLSF